MKQIDCSLCNNNVPLNNTVKIDGTIHCISCVETAFPKENMLQNKVIVQEYDPTVCAFCKADFDNEVLEKISQYPICIDCNKDVKNKTFPIWVKAFFAAVLFLVAFSFFWNWKYFTAYKNIQSANEYYAAGDFESAGKEMSVASNIVPEVPDLQLLSSYFNGIALLHADKNNEAIKELNKCKDMLPPDYEVDYLLLQARAGATFDNKDYEGFLSASKELMERDTASPYSYARVASAHACIYADKADEDAKKNAYDYLQKAREVDSTSADIISYYNAIEYRIYSRKIISMEEFSKQFPSGWTKS